MTKKEINNQDQCCAEIQQDPKEQNARRVSFIDDESSQKKPQQRSRSRKTNR